MPRSLLEQLAEETIASSEKATASAEKEVDDGRKWLIDCKSVGFALRPPHHRYLCM